MFAHYNATPEQVLAAQPKLKLKKPVYRSLKEAAAALAEIQAAQQRESYDSTTETTDDLQWVPASRARGMDGCFSSAQLSPQLLHHRPSSELPFRDLIVRKRWPGYSRIVDQLAEDADQRAARRLKEIGRRAYALELVARKQQSPQSRPTENQCQTIKTERRKLSPSRSQFRLPRQPKPLLQEAYAA